MKILLLALALASPVPADDSLELAARLLSDGHTERAALVLDEIPADAECDRARLLELRGIVAAERDRLPEAVRLLEESARLTPADAPDRPLRLRRLARVALLADQPRLTLQSLDQARALTPEDARDRRVRVDALLAVHDDEGALEVITPRAAEDPRLALRAVDLLTARGLPGAARRYARALDREPALLRRALRALRAAGYAREAVRLGERAALTAARSADEPELLAELAHGWVALGQLTVAARLMTRAALVDATFRPDAAELCRRAGERVAAARHTRALSGEAEKLRLRFAALLDAQRYAQAAALDSRLERAGVAREAEIAFALAYAHLHAGAPARALARLDAIEDPSVFARAASLRAWVERCEARPEACP